MGSGSRWREWRRVFRRTPEDEVDAELRFHIRERTEEYMNQGMDPAAARQSAMHRLGDLEGVRAECADLLAAERRAEERRFRVSLSWLDVKLGVRMLRKYPGLSLVSVIGMAVAIAVGAGAFAVIGALIDPTLPLEEGDRIVSIQNNRADDPGNPERRALHDLAMWRETLESVQDLGAFRSDRRNLITTDGNVALVRIAEMSAAGFRVARVRALLGRTLVDEDERPGAAPVIVIGYDEWQGRFGADPGILGRGVRLGAEVHTVVGVMPEGFRFPVAHRYWIPLRLNPSDYEVGGGPAIEIFGRLTDGVTLRQANAELTAIGQRQAVLRPETHAHLRPRILPYTHPMFDIDSPSTELALRGFQLAIGLLLIVVAVNVAILVYARTTTRAGEIAVRNALGASRRRVVTQLFVEGLVLSATGALLGLVIAGIALNQLEAYALRIEDALPFWFDISLSAGSIVYAAVLAIAGGAIVGVIPALKATGRRLHAGLQQLATRGSRMKLGRVWTTLIVVQVAIAVTALPAAVYWPGAMIAFGTTDPGYAIDEFIIAWLSMGRDEAPPTADAARYEREFAARFGDRTAELVRRLDAEPGVDVTFASRFPGIGEEVARIELEPGAGQAAAESGVARRGSPAGVPTESGTALQDVRSHGVLVNHVGTGLFDVFEVPVLAGRRFVDADVLEGATAVIVDQTFVDRVAGGGNVIGRRARYAGRRGADGQAGEPGRWFEIVGVVRPVAAPMLPATINEPEPRLYHPVAAGGAESSISKVCCIHETPGSNPREGQPTMLIVRVRNGSAAGFTDDVRNITAAVDPALQLHEMMPVTEWRGREQQGLRMIALGIVLVTASVLLLSAAGIYAMMSFTVARQRREIGIRSALGAEPRRLLIGIFARAGVQLAAGVALGLLFATVLELGSGGEMMGGKALYVLPVVSALILIIGLVAACGPARRGLAVQPTEALRAE